MGSIGSRTVLILLDKGVGHWRPEKREMSRYSNKKDLVTHTNRKEEVRSEGVILLCNQERRVLDGVEIIICSRKFEGRSDDILYNRYVG